MGAQIAAFDWSKTPIGPIESWSTTLWTVVRLLLVSPHPTLLWWGPDYISLYNDSYAPILGTKHPWALGQPCRQCWKEIWPVLQPLIDTPFGGGPATWIEDFGLELHRHGFLEECHFTVSYSAVPDDAAPGGIGGVIATVNEITGQVLGQRRVVALREVGARLGETKRAAQACAVAGQTLATYTHDVPFALLYLIDDDGKRARLAGAAGVPTGQDISPHSIDLTERAPHGWPFFDAVRSQTVQLVPELGRLFVNVPAGPWSDAPDSAALMPIPSSKAGVPAGLMVVGLSARLRFDDDYRSFLELLRTQIATAIARARAYEEERKRAEALAEIDRAKTNFFSNISHEFRTPLTLMLGPTEDLLAGVQGALAPAQRVQLELLRRNELRLQRLVNALLEFARIEAGRAQASYEPVDLSTLTRDIASSFRSLVERAGLKFEVSCPPLGEPVFVDPNMWEQIVLNLLSNAFKFTFEGEIEVSLRSTNSEVQLVVRDTGVGVRPGDLAQLFGRFHRVEGTRARTHEGSGIGLALTQELVRLHGGTIAVQSRFGEGTSFSVSIPRGSSHLPAERLVRARTAMERSPGPALFVEEATRWLPEETAGGAGNAVQVEAAQSVRTHAGRRILVADDNADMREYLRRILGEKWTVDTVSDGAAALERARATSPDLILADVMMPAMDGFQLLRELRSDPATRGVPFLLLSARAGEEARIEGLQAGADDYLSKPFSARELVARVATHLELYQLRLDAHAHQTDLLELIIQAPVPICVLRGDELVVEMVNQPFVDVVGRADVLGKRLLDALPELGGQGAGGRTFADLLREVRETGETFRADEVPINLRRNGHAVERYFNLAFSPIRSSAGTIERIMAVGTEVSAQVVGRRHAEEAERQIKDTLELRVEFLTAAAHELRTPLTTLGFQADGLLHLLRMAPAKDETAERLRPRAEKLRRQADRLAQIIDDMIDSFNLRPETLELVRTELDLADVARIVVERLRQESKQASAVISLRTEPAIGSWDRRRLEQILTALLSNAVKFGAGRPVEVEITCSARHARITARDSGLGIAPEDQARIFDRFVRLAPTTQFGGLGLGLWVVRELTLAMGGTVQVQSEAGRGAVFIVELPRTP